MIGVIIQARSGSKRFPNKIYTDLNGKSTLHRVLEGVSKAQLPHKIILAMPDYDEKSFKEFASKTDLSTSISINSDRFSTFFGDPDNLVDRYFYAARKEKLDTIVRVTGDCPLIQGHIIDEMLCSYFKEGPNCFMSNNELISHAPYPDGTDVEILEYSNLAETKLLTSDPYDLEHVTPFMYSKKSNCKIVPFNNCRPNSMISTKIPDFSFDTDEDYKLLQKLTKHYDESDENLNEAIKRTVAE